MIYPMNVTKESQSIYLFQNVFINQFFIPDMLQSKKIKLDVSMSSFTDFIPKNCLDTIEGFV